MKFILSALFMCFTLDAHSSVCPSESMPVEYISPTTRSKKLICGYMKNGSLVKHGPEIDYDESGNVKKTVSFNHGKEGEAPVKAALEIKEDTAEEKELMAVIQELMKILSFDKGGLHDGVFKVRKCDPNSKEWVKAAVLKSTVSKSYTFHEQCDVSGSFKARFDEVFPVNFNLRNLRDFTSTSMKVLMSLSNKTSGLRYRYEVTEASITSPSKSVHFNAEYEVDLDRMSGSAIPSTQQGTVTITKIGDKAVNIKSSILFNY